MTLSRFAKQAEKFAVDNSPTILTAVAVTGTLATAYLTGKATIKAYQLIDDAERIHGEPATNRDKFVMAWKLYIPAATSAGMTIVCIVGANKIGTRRAAAIATAYSLSERAFSEYREKIVEKVGEKREQAARDEIAQERVAENPPCEREIIIAGGEVLCYDAYSDRYFKSDVESIKKAQNDLNFRLINDNYASLTDFYNLLGLPQTEYSEEVGWNLDKMLDIKFSTVMSEDQRPCVSINFVVTPIRNYYRVH